MNKIRDLMEQWTKIQKERTELQANITQFKSQAESVTESDLSEISLEEADSFLQSVRYHASEEQQRKWSAFYEKRLRKEAPEKVKALHFQVLENMEFLSEDQIWATDKFLSCLRKGMFLHYGSLHRHTCLSYDEYEKLLMALKKEGTIEFLYRWDCLRNEETVLIGEQDYLQAMEGKETFNLDDFIEKILDDTCNLCSWEELCEDGERLRQLSDRKEFQKCFEGAERIGRMIK